MKLGKSETLNNSKGKNMEYELLSIKSQVNIS